MLQLKKTTWKKDKSINKNQQILLLNILEKCTRIQKLVEIVREDKLILRNKIKAEDLQVIKVIHKHRKPLNLHQMQIELRKYVTYIKNKIKLQQLNRFKQNLNTYQCTCHNKKQNNTLFHQSRQVMNQQIIYKKDSQLSKYKQSFYKNQIIEERNSFQEQTQKSSARLRVSPLSDKRFYFMQKQLRDIQQQEKGNCQNQNEFKQLKSCQQNKQIKSIKMIKEQQDLLQSIQTFKQQKQPQLKRSNNFQDDEEILNYQCEQIQNYNYQDYNNFFNYKEDEINEKFNKSTNRNSIREFKKNIIFQQKFIQIEPRESSNYYNVMIPNVPQTNSKYPTPQCTLTVPLNNLITINQEQSIKPQPKKQHQSYMKWNIQNLNYNTNLNVKEYNNKYSKDYDKNTDNYKAFQLSYEGYTDPNLLEQCRKIIQKKKIQSVSPKNNFSYTFSPIIQYNYNMTCTQHQQQFQIPNNQYSYRDQENKYPINNNKQMLQFNNHCQNVIQKQNIIKKDDERKIQQNNFAKNQQIQRNSSKRQYKVKTNQKQYVFPSPFENRNKKNSRFQFSYQNQYNKISKRSDTEECQQQQICMEIDIFREKYAEDIFDVFFQNKSIIFLSQKHFTNLLVQILEAQEIQFEEESILQLFYLIDKVNFFYQKNDGKIDPIQLGQALQILATPKDNQLKFIFKLIDHQNKGKIYKGQFKQFMNQIIQDNQEQRTQIHLHIQRLYQKADFTNEGAIYYWYLFFLKNSEEVLQLLQFLNQYQFQFQ